MKLLRTISILLLFCGASKAANFYVTQSGAGSTNGTSLANAWSMAQFNATTSTNPGDTVYFSGTITTTLTPGDSGGSGNPITLNLTSATLSGSGTRININGRNNLTLLGGTITGATGDVINFGTSHSTNITIDGFTYTGPTNGTAIFLALFTGSCTNLILQNCTVDNMASLIKGHSTLNSNITVRNNYARTSTSNDGTECDIIRMGDLNGMLIEGNYIENRSIPTSANNHADCIQTYAKGGSDAGQPTNWVIRYNYIVMNSASGSGDASWMMIEAQSGTSFTIYSNIFLGIGNVGNNGIAISRSAAADTCYLYNNTVIRHNVPGNTIRFELQSPGTLYAKNNVGMADSAATGIFLNWQYAEGGGTNGWNHNFWYQFDNATANHAGPNGSISTNPLFVNFAGNNFETQSGSPLRNGGDPTIGATYNQGIAFGATWPNPTLVTRTAGNWDVGAYQFAAAGDLPPSLSTASISTSGTQITLVFSEAIQFGAGGNGGWTLNLSNGPVTLSNPSGSGTSRTYTLSRIVGSLETGTISYAQPGNGIEDTVSPFNDMATIPAIPGNPVINNSTVQQVNAPTVAPAAGPYFGVQNIVFSSSTPGATIRYTTDGTDPIGTSTQYTASIPTSISTNYRARAFASGMIDSAVTAASYEIGSWVSTSAWKTFVVPQQVASFTWTFRASAASAGTDSIVGLSAIPATTFTDLATILRFNPTGIIDAYNGDVSNYAAVNSFTWIAGTTYEFVLTINVATKRYSMTASQIGGAPVIIANNYLFRNQAVELDNVGLFATANSITVSQMSFGTVTGTIPTLTSATIGSNGTNLTLGFDVPVNYGTGGNGGWTLSASGGAATLTPSASPTSFTISRAIAIGENVTVSYVQPGNGVEATTGGGDLASRSAFGVNNQSTIDLTAPIPNPSTFSIAPTPTGTASITMTATTSTDANSGPVQYFFNETSGNAGGSDSGWQPSPTFTDTGLAAGTQYTYRVRTRDSATTPNMTSFSSTMTATTQSVAGAHPAMPFNVARANILNP